MVGQTDTQAAVFTATGGSVTIRRREQQRAVCPAGIYFPDSDRRGA